MTVRGVFHVDLLQIPVLVVWLKEGLVEQMSEQTGCHLVVTGPRRDVFCCFASTHCFQVTK